MRDDLSAEPDALAPSNVSTAINVLTKTINAKRHSARSNWINQRATNAAGAGGIAVLPSAMSTRECAPVAHLRRAQPMAGSGLRELTRTSQTFRLRSAPGCGILSPLTEVIVSSSKGGSFRGSKFGGGLPGGPGSSSMVAKFVASVRGFTHRGVVTIAVLALLPLLMLLPGRAEGSSYANPWWSNNSASPESAIGLVASRAMSPEGVDLRTGEWIYDHELFTTPGLVADN